MLKMALIILLISFQSSFGKNTSPYQEQLVEEAYPLKNSQNLRPLINNIKDKKIVMLGEASHGTQEYYEWRRLITIELVRNHGFDLVAVEADWPASWKVNNEIKRGAKMPATDVLKAYSRWPSWMWSNTEIGRLMEELRSVNSTNTSPVAFYGLDVYSLYESIDQVLSLLRSHSPHNLKQVKELYSCLEPYRDNEESYTRAQWLSSKNCKIQVEQAHKIVSNMVNNKDFDKATNLNLIQNATIVMNAERYYRSMGSFSQESWNIRDHHMMSTLDRLLEHHGPDSKVIVWEHNTHIGDYRGTDMVDDGMVNIGGLARDAYGEKNVALVGFASYQGSVLAAREWEGKVMKMDVPKAASGSLEEILHNQIPKIGSDDYFLLLNKDNLLLKEVKGHRAIGVVYQPELEAGNYVPTKLSMRYDALIFLNETKALTPL